MADMNVFVYPNQAHEDSFAKRVSSAVRTALDSIVSDTDTIESRRVELRYEHPGDDVSGRDCDGVDDDNKWDFHREFDTYTDCHHPNEVGCHLGVSTNNIGGLGDGGDGFGGGEGAFVERRNAVTGGSSEYYENLAIQEMLHTFLDYRIVAPWDAHPNDASHEHDLGTRTEGGLEQPMATGYYGQYGNHGEDGSCANRNVERTGYTHVPSRCSTRALDATYKSDFNSTPSTSPSERWAETRTVELTNDWKTIDLLDTYEYPVVLAQPISSNGPQPATVRFRNITRNSSTVECRIDEWDYLDGYHVRETVGIMAILDGRVQNDGRTRHIESGVRLGVDEDWYRVVYDQPTGFDREPIVITQPQTYHGWNGIVTRVKDVTASTFEVRLQEQESKYDANQGHLFERVGWLATPPGTGRLDGVQYEAGRTWLDHTWTTVHFESSYDAPVFLADMQTFNGNNPCTVRYRNLSATSVDVRLHEETSSDDETKHFNDERVGYFVMEAARVD